ncbi:nucleoporin NUP42 [Geosmithia morbida]|uniref:Nucleoporin NUP42 n=1 Tax=Geosmithia morbida TaxID=1094350 RepID=A0A9P4Z2S6_9HYPO|nr:nucleoporin NUP42 [Geosmithia morbida]KAF4126178.1 nucleoporin NUP42 [Geosmithia morbida]
MPLCRYFQQGNCKFGSRCRFDHPGATTQSQSQTSNSYATNNRFGLYGKSAGGKTTGSKGNSGGKTLEDYKVSTDTIKADLTTETPQWILSAYGPGRNTPEQLFGGYPREQSFEEMRLHYLTGKAEGREQEVLNQAQELYKIARQQMDNAVNNVVEAANFVVGAENTHPNRHDICQQGTQGQPFGEFSVGKRSLPSGPSNTNASPFKSAGQTNSSSAFGVPSGGTSAFGQPSQPPSAFGQPSQPAPSVFGQPSQPAANPFGQPSTPLQQTPAFGQPSQPAPASGFGTPSFGQPSQPTSTFGQPSKLGTSASAFGRPSFGQPPQPAAQQPSAFGQPSQPPAAQQTSAFGQPSQLGQNASPFAASGAPPQASPFGAANTGASNNAPGAFGQPSQAPAAPSNTFGSASQTTSSPFGQPSQAPPSGAFGKPAAAAAAAPANPFGSASNNNQANETASPFGQKAPNHSPFESQPQQQSTSGTFGQASTPNSNPFGSAQPPQQQQASAFSQPQQTSSGTASTSSNNPYPPESTRQHPPIESYTTKGMDGRLSMFRGKPVTYHEGKPGIKNLNGTFQRIWFPDGPPSFNKDTALAPDAYDGPSKAQWASFAETGQFAEGVMPELPPPRECTLWNF